MAADDEVKEEESGETEKLVQQGKNPLLVILVILNTLICAGIGYVQFLDHQKVIDEQSIKDLIAVAMKSHLNREEQLSGEGKEESGVLFPLDKFITNLAVGDGGRKYLRMRLVLKFSRNSNEEEFQARKPQIRDTILSILNSKRPEDLLKPEGKKYLKEEIKSSINKFLIDGDVIDILC